MELLKKMAHYIPRERTYRDFESYRPPAIDQRHAFLRLRYECACREMQPYWRKDKNSPSQIALTYKFARDDLSLYLTKKIGAIKIKYPEYLKDMILTDHMLSGRNS